MSANSEASLQGMRVKVEYRLNQVEVGTSTIYRLQYIYRRGSGQASMVQGKVTEVELGVGPMGETQGKGRRNPRGHGSGDESESGGMSHGKSEGYSGWPMGSVLGVSTTPVPI